MNKIYDAMRNLSNEEKEKFRAITTEAVNTLLDNSGPKSTGWICPRCGRGVSPLATSCPCYFEGVSPTCTTNTATITTDRSHFIEDTMKGKNPITCNPCTRICDNKTALGYCKSTVCIKHDLEY